MAQKSQDTKFSMLEDDAAVMDKYLELERFIRYLAYRNAGELQVLMSVDEIIGELNVEFVKGFQRYGDLPDEQFRAVLRRMFDNRIVELKCRFYETHREHEKMIISLDISVGAADIQKLSPFARDNDDPNAQPVEELIEGDPDVDELYSSNARVLETRSRLSPNARKVFDAVVYGNAALAQVMYLVCQRASAIFKECSPGIRAWHIADALGMSEKEVKKAIKEIKASYEEVCNGSI